MRGAQPPDLHPLTVASIAMQTDNCCGPRNLVGIQWWVCEYHQGFQDGIDQLLAQQCVDTQLDSLVAIAFGDPDEL